jgi:hypothetical protein
LIEARGCPFGGGYQKKDWRAIEFGSIRKIITQRDHQRIMFIRIDRDSPASEQGVKGRADNANLRLMTGGFRGCCASGLADLY